MRTLLLFAKYIAIKEKASIIENAHFDASLMCIKRYVRQEAQDKYEDIRAAFSQPHVSSYNLAEKYAKDFNPRALSIAENSPIVLFSPQLNNQLEKLAFPQSLKIWVIETHLIEPFDMHSEYRHKLAELEQLKYHLLQKVYGQDHAVEGLIDCMATSLWHNSYDKPQGVFLFAGPPASGKTFLAEHFAKQLDDNYSFKLFDMTHYTNTNEAFGLVGSKKTYDDSAPGQLTTFVKENPKSVIVFDEFEKAHSQVLLSLLRMLSSGWLHDEYTEEEVDFRQCIIIFTSNLGRAVYSKQEYIDNLESCPSKARAALLEQFRKETKIERDQEVLAIPPEMLSRLSQGSVLLFKSLGITELKRIAKQQLTHDLDAFYKLSRFNLTSFVDELANILLLSFAPIYDIRDIKANISSKIIDPLSDYLRRHPQEQIHAVNLLLSDDIQAILAESAGASLFSNLKKRNETFSVKIECENQDADLVIRLFGPKRDAILRAEDIETSGGIVLEVPTLKFSDIAGHDAIKQRLIETISILNSRESLINVGITPPKGLVLFGPPGTGKTTLARALASEANLPFLSCSGNDLLAKSFIETLFERARKYAPCILFIDELDALPKRGEAGALADALLNRLLVEIDGFNQSEEPIFVVAATNRLDKIDPALLRSGRLDLHLEVANLDKAARRWFIQRFLNHDCYSSEIDAEVIVNLTSGLSGADLEKIHRESVLRSISKQHQIISQSALIEQVNVLKYGAKRSQESCEKALLETAYHEAGHAVLSLLLTPERKIEQISVIPRGNSQGMVAYNSEQNIDYTKNYWFSLCCIALAGRGAQIKRFAEDGLDTGASSDLREAMRCAWLAIAKYGMHQDSYNMDVTALQQWTNDSYFRGKMEALVQDWINEATTNTDRLIEQHWGSIEKVAKALLEKETLSEMELKQLLEGEIPNVR